MITEHNPAFEDMTVNLLKDVQKLLRSFVATNLDSDIEELQSDAEALLMGIEHVLRQGSL